MDDPTPTRNRSLATVKTVGWVAGAILAGALIAVLLIDHRVHVADAGRDSLVPWWLFVGWGALYYALYWVGFGFLLRTLRRHDADTRQLVSGLTVANERLAATEFQFRALFERNPLPFCVYDAETLRFMAVNDALVEQFGYSREAYLDMTILDMVPPEQHEAAIAQVRENAGQSTMEARIWTVVAENGNARQIRIHSRAIRFQARDAWLLLAEDVTEALQSHERLVAAEQQFRALFERNPLPFWVYDAQTLEILEANPAAQRQYGYSHEEFLGKTILDIRPAEERERVRAYTGSADGNEWPREVRVWRHQRKDGSALEVRIHVQAIRFHGRAAYLILGEDVTQALAQQRELAWRATHEPDTHLLNARALADAIQKRADAPWRLAYIQMRGLELIEDSLGREVGLRVMQRMARRLEQLGLEYGEVGHVRPEEFVLAVRDPARWDAALQTLRDALERPVIGQGSRQQLESWIGTADFPGDHPDAMEVIGQAALAAHLARAENRELVAFEPSMSHLPGQRLRMAARLHRALEQDEFELYFQQIRRLADGRPTGLEALLRWPQIEGGFVPPCDFISVAEDTGMIVPLGRWVLRQAAQAHQRLALAGHGDMSIAINVSQVQFLKSDLLQDFDEIAREFALPRGALHIELTESILMTRPDQARALLQELQDRGVCISLDDFGTGFSSMAYLHHLPIDALKIDRAFVHRVHTDRRNASICQALLQLGHSLDLTVVAEGVEQQEEYDWLREHQCDKAQGYCIARPAPIEKILETL